MIFDYERRIQALEARVQALEDALKKERAAQVPDAQAQEKVTAQSSPAPAVQTPEKIPEHSPVQQTVSAQLRAALDAPADTSCFQYMPEPGTVTDFWNNQKPRNRSVRCRSWSARGSGLRPTPGLMRSVSSFRRRSAGSRSSASARKRLRTRPSRR